MPCNLTSAHIDQIQSHLDNLPSRNSSNIGATADTGAFRGSRHGSDTWTPRVPMKTRHPRVHVILEGVETLTSLSSCRLAQRCPGRAPALAVFGFGTHERRKKVRPV
jgi:hypothetical protein